MSSVKKLAIRGTVWTIANYGAGQVLRFGSNVILTRLLFPALFGLMSLGNTFVTGMSLFSDIGIGTSIVQNKRGDDPVFLNTAWTMQATRGFGLWVCCLLIAWPLATFYEEPKLLWLIPVLGLNSIVGGFNSTAMFTLERHMVVGKLTVLDLGGQVISLAVILVWAWLSPTIWALVGGSLVSAVVRMVWSHLLIPGSTNRFAWDKDAVKEIFSFGKWIFVSTALTFLAEQADRLILGKLFSFQLLGVYTVAFVLSDLPRQVLGALSGKVLFPTFAKFADLPRAAFRAKILKNRLPLLLVMAVGLTVLVAFGDKLILKIYDKRYIQAAWILPLLALGIWPRILTQTIDQVFYAVGKPNYPSYGYFFKLLFVVIGLPIGYHFGNLFGAVTVVALNDFPYYGAVIYGLWREQLSVAMQDLKVTALFLALLAVVLIARSALGFGLPIDTLLLQH